VAPRARAVAAGGWKGRANGATAAGQGPALSSASSRRRHVAPNAGAVGRAGQRILEAYFSRRGTKCETKTQTAVHLVSNLPLYPLGHLSVALLRLRPVGPQERPADQVRRVDPAGDPCLSVTPNLPFGYGPADGASELAAHASSLRNSDPLGELQRAGHWYSAISGLVISFFLPSPILWVPQKAGEAGEELICTL
jgi:hypothetical protein